MIQQGQVGPTSTTSSISVGSQPPVRLGNTGALITSNGLGAGYEGCYQGRRFGITNQAAVATTAALATTYTGLVVGNPVGSGFNLVIDKFQFSPTAVIPTACAVGIMTGVSTTAITNTLTIRNRKLGAAFSSVAAASAGQTIGTPILEQLAGYFGTVAIASQPGQPMPGIDLSGTLIVPPGYFVAAYTSAATTATFIFNFQWEEVPV